MQICARTSSFSLRKREEKLLAIYGITKRGIYMINAKHLKFAVPKEYKRILTVSKDGQVKAIGKRGQEGIVVTSLKNRPECSCVISVEVR